MANLRILEELGDFLSDVHERQIRAVAAREQIDTLVYELYGLTKEEIGIVEGA